MSGSQEDHWPGKGTLYRNVIGEGGRGRVDGMVKVAGNDQL